MGTVIHLDQHVLAACKDCGSTEWRILLDKIEYTQLLGIKCTGCGADITMNMNLGDQHARQKADTGNTYDLV